MTMPDILTCAQVLAVACEDRGDGHALVDAGTLAALCAAAEALVMLAAEPCEHHPLAGPRTYWCHTWSQYAPCRGDEAREIVAPLLMPDDVAAAVLSSGYGSGYGDGSGSGDGDGYVDGYGYGDGSGYGDGTGTGYGTGSGDGDGDGTGYGSGSGYGYGTSGYGDGSGSGSGYGYGYGYGDGYGSGYGDGSGSGSGYGGGYDDDGEEV